MILDSSNNSSITEQIEVGFSLACLWLQRGKIERAIAGFQRVLELQPDHLQAAVHLEHAQQQQDWFQLRINAGQSNSLLQENPDGKLNLAHQKTFAAHRCGWNFAIHALKPLHNAQGVLFDGFLDNTFTWQENQSKQQKQPYRHPWVGFLHNPPAMPTWFFYQNSPQILFTHENWKQSLEFCVGLFTLSEYYAKWLRDQIDKPVSALIYPTEIPELQFDYDRFIANPKKKIIQLGWWLRKLAAIYQLPIARDNLLGYQKVKLNAAFALDAETTLERLVAKQIEVEQITLLPEFLENTLELTHVSNQQYDELLSQNIGFVSLYDASANTTIIECIARATPLLVNPLPAVVEYLGEEYPFYFNTLTEAAEKALDTSLILDTHCYLKTCETRNKISADYFLKSFCNSKVYQRI